MFKGLAAVVLWTSYYIVIISRGDESIAGVFIFFFFVATHFAHLFSFGCVMLDEQQAIFCESFLCLIDCSCFWCASKDNLNFVNNEPTKTIIAKVFCSICSFVRFSVLFIFVFSLCVCVCVRLNSLMPENKSFQWLFVFIDWTNLLSCGNTCPVHSHNVRHCKLVASS